jgi:hypothetical protein
MGRSSKVHGLGVGDVSSSGNSIGVRAGSSSGAGGGVQVNNNSSSRSALDLWATLPDTTVGGLPLNAIPKASGGVVSSSSNGGGGATNGASSRKGTISSNSCGPDVNLALTSAPDWGQVTGGGYEPPERKQLARPGDKQLQEEGKGAGRWAGCRSL